MAPLPSDRITSSYPFSNSDVGYAGPLLLRTKRERGYPRKDFFIRSLAFKAIYLEAVTDLMSVAFLAAFRRFMATT